MVVLVVTMQLVSYGPGLFSVYGLFKPQTPQKAGDATSPLL